MDETTYLQLAHEALKALATRFDRLDPDAADAESTGDVLTVTFANGVKCIVNTQRPTRQLWVAAKSRAWHFSWDERTREWRDDKDASVELFAQVARVTQEQSGLTL